MEKMRSKAGRQNGNIQRHAYQQAHYRRVEDLLYVEDVQEMPGVLGEHAERKGFSPHEAGRVIRQAFLPTANRYPLLQAVKHSLGRVEHQRIWVACRQWASGRHHQPAVGDVFNTGVAVVVGSQST